MKALSNPSKIVYTPVLVSYTASAQLKYRTLKVSMINGSSETVARVGNGKQPNGYGRAFGSIVASFKSALR